MASHLTVNTDPTTGAVKPGDTFSGVLSGPSTGFLVKAGAGTLVLSGDNKLTTTTTVTGGSLQLGNGGVSGSLNQTTSVVNNVPVYTENANVALTGGSASTLIFDRSVNVTYAGKISGPARWNKRAPAPSS